MGCDGVLGVLGVKRGVWGENGVFGGRKTKVPGTDKAGPAYVSWSVPFDKYNLMPTPMARVRFL